MPESEGSCRVSSRLKARALRLLARREYGRAELKARLVAPASSIGESSDEVLVEDLLDWLADQGFQSDDRFVESMVRRWSIRHGNALIKARLKGLGIAPDLIARCCGDLSESEFERAHAMWVQRFGSVPEDAQSRAKQIRFLIGRGFSAGTASRVLRTSLNDR